MRQAIKQKSMNDEQKRAKEEEDVSSEMQHKRLTINLDLNIHNKLIRAAAKQGCTPEELAARQISKLLQADPGTLKH